MVTNYLNSLHQQFGLSDGEITTIINAQYNGQTFKQYLAQLRSQLSADPVNIRNLIGQRENAVACLANQILNSVSALSKQRLLAPGLVTSMSLPGSPSSASATLPVAPPIPQAWAPNLLTKLADFQDCIGPSGTAPVCQLAPKTYYLPFTDNSGYPQYGLTIGRSNVAAYGTMVGGPSDTVIKRADTSVTSKYPPPVVYVGSSSLSNVTLGYLTIDGNRYSAGNNTSGAG